MELNGNNNNNSLVFVSITKKPPPVDASRDAGMATTSERQLCSLDLGNLCSAPLLRLPSKQRRLFEMDASGSGTGTGSGNTGNKLAAFIPPAASPNSTPTIPTTNATIPTTVTVKIPVLGRTTTTRTT
jgi:hypothetical protein